MAHSPARPALEVGSVIADTYTLEQLIGRGGMGAVFLASHARLPGKQVAIKLLHAEVDDAEVIARFRHEATIASQLNHPNIVEVHDFNVMPDGTPYLVLEYLVGETLAQRLRAGPLPLDHALSIMREVGSALAAAHRNGVVHRDLKPANIFLVRTEIDGRLIEVAKVLDFGISKMRSSQTVKTQDNSLLGTPQYMSPEQAVGAHTRVDERTDVFALGSILYEMLCGHPAFSGASIPEVVFKVVYEQPPPLGEEAPTLPRAVTAAIEQAMAKSASDRFANVGAFVEALTGEALATSHASGQVSAIAGPASVRTASEAGSARSASNRVRAMTPAEAIGETQGPGVARASAPSSARPQVNGTDRTIVGVGAAPGPVAAGNATVASVSDRSPVSRPADAEASAPEPEPVSPAPVRSPSSSRSRMPLIALLVAAAAGAVAVYIVMRPPAAHAPADAAVQIAGAAPADAARPAPDAAITLVTPPDAAVPPDARAVLAVAPHDAGIAVVAHDDAATLVATDDATERADLATAERALGSKDYHAATAAADAVIHDANARPADLAHAIGIHGVAACRDGAQDMTARTDLTRLAQIKPPKVTATARKRIITQCRAAGLLEDVD